MDKQVRPTPLDLIDVPPRLRKIDPDYADAIGASMAERGQDTPIWVFPATSDGHHELITGAHRHEGARLHAIKTLDVLIFQGSRDEARLLEIDENLQRRELCELDRATFLAERKAVWLRLHPEARQGSRGTGWMRGNSSSFGSDVARTIGVTPRQVNKIIRRFEAIPGEIRDTLAGTELADNGALLDRLARLKGEDQRAVVKMLLADLKDGGKPRPVAAALASLHGQTKPALSLEMETYRGLMAAWGRYQNAAGRKKFLAEVTGKRGGKE